MAAVNRLSNRVQGYLPFCEFRHSFWSVADQGAVSIGNFLTQIVLARALPRLEYGVFALLYGAMILVLNSCHSSMIAYPLSVNGAQTDLAGLRRITSSSLMLTVLGISFQAPVVFLIALVLKEARLTLLLVFALACWQLQETLRRALMAHLRHRGAIFGDALSYIGQTILLWALAYWATLTLTAVFLVIALTSLAAAALQATQVGLGRVSLHELQGLIRSCWRLGKWNFLGNATGAAAMACFPWTLGLSRGPQETAAYQAVANLLGISHPAIMGAGNLLVPAVSRARSEGGIRLGARTTFRLSAGTGLLILPYFVFLAVNPHGVLSFFYGHNSVYVDLGASLRLFVFAYAFVFLLTVTGAFLNGIEKSGLFFIAGACGALTLILGIPLAIRYGTLGASAGFAIICLVRAAAAAILIWGLFRSDLKIRVSELQRTEQ